MSNPLNPERALKSAEETWEGDIVHRLSEYILIPNKSPGFDSDWARPDGPMHKAVELIAGWCRKQPIPGLTVEVVQLHHPDGSPRTPLIYMEVPGTGTDTVVLYGHLDKQPEMSGWRAGLDPWKPVREGDRLYGRGGADDGYSAFASLTALKLLHEQGVPHARCVVLIEADEESGSDDLPAYVDHLKARIGTPSLVVCLDSGCGNYDQLWSTTSLRGLVGGLLHVRVLREGVHSGDASGVVPSSFRIARTLLSRIEDEVTGRVLLPELHVEIPEARRVQARRAAEALESAVHSKFPFAGGTRPMVDDRAGMVLNRTWRPALSVIGAAGFPPFDRAGNVLRPETLLKLSMRVPPRCDPDRAALAMKTALEHDPPYGAEVTFTIQSASSGWDAPPTAAWLDRATDGASKTYFGRGAMAMGEGGTIPFMGMLGERFPDAQFLITGVLGPESNAHGPNEFLHIPTGVRLTCCVASVLAAHLAR